MWEWLIWQMPWWLQAAMMAITVGVPVLLVAFMLWGPKAVLRAILPVLGVIVTLGLASKFRQDGYRKRVEEDQAAIDRAEEIVDKKRDEVHNLPDDKLDERFDRWSKP